MLRERYPLYAAGRAESPNADLVVTNKFTGEPAARVALADDALLDRAIAAAASAAEPCRRLPAHRRAAACSHLASRLAERAEELARVLAVEVGKPIRDSRVEVSRAVDTFRIAAEEATRLRGEYAPLDVSPRAEGVESIWKRVPVGPCAFITPFNFPLNLVAHKVAPALAVGCPFVLKPASNTPVSALIVAEALAEAGLPEGAFSVLPAPRRAAERLVTDDRIRALSFTGSAEVGWAMKSRAGRKKVTLELGGNAACIVDRGVDLDHAAARVAFGAFYQAGQSCISVQRVFVHEEVAAPFRERLVARTRALVAGDPLREDTFLGPLITVDDARRVEAWVAEATARGARLLCGGARSGRMYDATLLEGVPHDCALWREEVFGPVALLETFTRFDDACARANDSRFGLQAGVFTRDLDHALYAWNHLEVGGVVIGDVPSFRTDSMPYGGVKESGFGREGVRFAMEELTEMRLLVLAGFGLRTR